MNRICFLSLSVIVMILFTFNHLYSQETKKVVVSRENEEYFVLKSNKKIKHGEYKRYSPFKNKVVIMKGQYENNERTGIWEYFDGLENPNQRFDYTNSKVLYHQVSSIFKISRLLNDEPIKNLTSPPIYLNGEMALVAWIVNNVKYPITAARNKKTGKFLVYFTIDKSGKPKDFHVKGPSGFGLDTEALRTIKNIPSDFWFPGMIDDKPVDVEIYMPVNFTQN